MTGSIPPDNYGDVNNFDLFDKPVPVGSSQPVAPWPSVTPGYFTALNIRLLEGRLFTPADSGTAPPVVVVSRAWAMTSTIAGWRPRAMPSMRRWHRRGHGR